MRSALFIVALAGCATSGMMRIAEGMDVAAYVSEDPGARHAHPAAVSESQIRAALLKDGSLVDAQIGSIAGACASELQHLQPHQRIIIKSGMMLAIFVEDQAIVVARMDSGTVLSQMRHSIAAPPPPAEIMALPAAPATTSGQSGGPDSGRAKARAMYESAIAHYNLGEIAEALESFTTAYRLFPDAVLLFNIAQCQRRMRQSAKAAETYRAFLREAPNAPNRDEVNRFIEEMDHASR